MCQNINCPVETIKYIDNRTTSELVSFKIADMHIAVTVVAVMVYVQYLQVFQMYTALILGEKFQVVTLSIAYLLLLIVS